MFYSIGEFAKLVGVSTHTLRLWEEQGKLIPHHRTQGNHRVYSQEQVDSYLGDKAIKKDIKLTFGGGLVQKSPIPISDLTDEEIDQVIHTAEAIKANRNK